MKTLEVLFPKARRVIIRLLFTGANTSLHMRELVRLSGLAIGTMQSELAKLRDVGLLEEHRDGNRLYFRANSAHPLFPEMRGIATKTTGDDLSGTKSPVRSVPTPRTNIFSPKQPRASVLKTETKQWNDVLNLGGL